MSFPATLDNFTPHVDGSDDIMAIDVNELQSAIEALEAKMGVDDSEVATTIDYRVAALESGKQDALGFTPENSANKGSANGYASLGSDGKVPSGQLPSYVDDVLEYANFAALPVTGETGKIYITLDDNKTYRWSGSAYVEISASLALGETSATAYRGDRGKTAYDHSQLTTGNPHAVTKSDVGLDNVTNDAQITKAIGTAAGDIIYFTGNATPARLAKGNDGQVLTLASGLPSWADAAGGGSPSTFGDGSDGDVTISADTNLSRDMFYNNLTINNGITLSPCGYKIFVKGELTCVGTGKIASNGGNGGNGTNASGAANGTPGTAGTIAYSGNGTLPSPFAGLAAGAVGSAGNSGTSINKSLLPLSYAAANGGNGGGAYSDVSIPGAGGGSGGVVSSIALGKPYSIGTYANLFDLINGTFTMFSNVPQSGSGASGQNSGWGAGMGGAGGGGGSGATGGFIWIAASNIVNLNVESKGGTGGNGGVGNSSSHSGGSGGGGGGGNGGIILLFYSQKTTITSSVAGGNGGTGGTSTYSGTNGQNGNAGLVKEIIL